MSRAPALFAAATFVYALFVLGRSFGAACQPGLLALLQLGLILLLSTGAGRVMLRWLGVGGVSESQKTLLGATLGLGALSLVTFALCAAHALYLWTALAALGALWVIGATELRDVVVSLGANRNLLSERPLPAAGVAALLGLSLWWAWVPPHQYDALVYHLPLPAAYIRAHGFVTVPTLVYTHFPQNAEMLYTLALLMNSELLAQMFMWLASALSVWWVFELGRREAPLSAVLLACLLLASSTAFLLLGSIAYVEPLVMLWTTASLFSFLRWLQLDGADGPGDRGWLTLSAIFLGLALGTKYYAGIAAVLLGGWMLVRLLRAEPGLRGRRAADAAAFVGLTTLVFLPWLVKNAVMAGNPVFPFLNGLFPATAEGWNAEVAKGYFSVLTEYRGVRGLADLARLPGLLLTNDPRLGGGMDVLGTLGWDLTFWALPLGVWAGWRNRFFRGLLAFCGLYGLAWAATGVVLRFLLVLAPALALLAANGLYALRQRLDGAPRLMLHLGVAVLVACRLLLFLFVELGVYRGHEVLLGLKTKQEYLSARLDYYPCARYVSERGSGTDKILLVGEQRGYYLDRPHTATSVHAPNRFLAWADAAASPGELAGKLRSEGYSRLIVVPREMKRLGAGVGAVTEKGAANWQGLEPAHASTEFRGPGCVVWALGPGA